MKRIGVDTGGTFTDSVLWDDESGVVTSTKVSSDKTDPSRAVMAAVGKLGPDTNVGVGALVHGTTVATNAVLERSGPRIGMLCTAGFRDILEIGRLRRPPEQIYDLRSAAPQPLVKRRDRLEAPERIDHRGHEITPLNEGAVRNAAQLFGRRGIDSVAVCFLHSYANASHERRAREILLEEMPNAVVSISSDVVPEFREYERSTTTALNAYLAPVVGGYLRRLQEAAAAWSSQTALWVMQSNGGVTSAEKAAQLPVTLLLSGPSGGVVASRHVMEQAGLNSAITMDMGGTSYDVCLLPDRNIPMSHERQVLEMPIKTPSIDILTIGAGGGSIGWVDGARQFRVGPRSAGAFPGPACYGRGGIEATVTDANLVLGAFGAAQSLGGEVILDADLAHRACERLGRKLGISALEAAWGIRQIANAAMAGATRTVSMGRGHDPRDFSLIAFGGAGPMHGVDIASELDIPTVVVPAVPGCLSAMGLVVSDIVHNYVATHVAVVADGLEAALKDQLLRLATRAHAELSDDKIEPAMRDTFQSLDMHYIGQQWTINVGVNANADGWLSSAVEKFHAQHHRMYGFSAKSESVGVTNARLRAIGRFNRANRHQQAARPITTKSAAPSATRAVQFGPRSDDRVETAVYMRDNLRPGTSFVGPAIVEQSDSTLLIPPRSVARSDAYANLIVQRNAA
jgi:N-methylhydantoinase A